MEPRGCNRWPSAANRLALETGKTSGIRCDWLPPVAVWDRVDVFRRERRQGHLTQGCGRLPEQPAQLRDRHRFGLAQLQVLLDEPGERGRATAARTDPIERLPERLPEPLLCFRVSHEPAHLRPSRTSSFEPIPVGPQRLPSRALRLELEGPDPAGSPRNLLDRQRDRGNHTRAATMATSLDERSRMPTTQALEPTGSRPKPANLSSLAT
jgi:hypothetical protein